MSLFLLTNKRNKAEKAKQCWREVFGNAEIFNLRNGLFLTLTSAYRKRKNLYKKYNNKSVFGFGTFFTESGFDYSAICSSVNLCEFDAVMAKKIFGHYIFVIQSEENVRVITDKVGVLNVFYVCNPGEIYISNDLTLIAGVSSNIELSEYGVQQFVFNESCIGTYTIFKKIKRLKNGCELIINSTMIKENIIYDNRIEELGFDEYIRRVECYFSMIAQYDGQVATDMSAGYDTRLVASCAYEKIKKLKAITNENKFDNGIDESTSPIVAKKLELPLEIIRNKTFEKINIGVDFIGFYTGRDVIRSLAWLPRLKEKYSKSDLMLGGYGGETLRAKYNSYNSFDLFSKRFYQGDKIPKYSYINNSYINSAIEELHAYDYKIPSENFGNMIYTMDRMRIWGGHSIAVTSLYGDILHPFMDSYLIIPILGWNSNGLKDARLQKKIMEHFSIGITEIPFNAINNNVLDDYLKNSKPLKKYIIRVYYKLFAFLRKIVNKILLRFNKKKEMKKIYDIFPKEKLSDDFQRKCNINLNKLEQYGIPSYISRLVTVKIEMDFALEIKKNTECNKETGSISR